MTLARTYSIALVGAEGHLVEVEADIAQTRLRRAPEDGEDFEFDPVPGPYLPLLWPGERRRPQVSATTSPLLRL